MHLTNEQEKILEGEIGEVMERLFRLLVRLGEIYNADEMIPVGSVQVAGVSYKSIGDPGTEFLEDMVSKGQRLGFTGISGLASGDHLHFGMFIHHVFVNPIEWWDASWIKNNITSKMDSVKSRQRSFY